MTKRKDRSGGERALLTAADERISEQCAMLRSLKPEHTGLQIKSHNRLVGLLVHIVSFCSDGSTTSVRVRTLARHLNASARTVNRVLANAAVAGLMVSQPQQGDAGQTVSSERTILWEAIADKLGRDLPYWAKENASKRLTTEHTPPQTAVVRGPLTTDTLPLTTDRGPLSTDTPISLSTSLDFKSNSKTNLRSGSPDVRTKNFLRVEEIQDRVAWLFDRLCYDGSEGHSLWLAVAAEAIGMVSEADLVDSCEAVNAIRPRDRVAYFRSVLAGRLEMTKAEFTEALRTLRLLPCCPGCRPSRVAEASEDAAVTPPAPKPASSVMPADSNASATVIGPKTNVPLPIKRLPPREHDRVQIRRDKSHAAARQSVAGNAQDRTNFINGVLYRAKKAGLTDEQREIALADKLREYDQKQEALHARDMVGSENR